MARQDPYRSFSYLIEFDRVQQGAFSRAKGLYGGLNIDGTVIAVANAWNEAYYGRGVLPPDILVRGSVHNVQADRLAAALSRATSDRTSLK